MYEREPDSCGNDGSNGVGEIHDDQGLEGEIRIKVEQVSTSSEEKLKVSSCESEVVADWPPV